MNMDSILERVAQENHTSLAEVRREIDAAIQTGLANTDPAVQAAWRTVPCEGGVPTAEELILWAVVMALCESNSGCHK